MKGDEMTIFHRTLLISAAMSGIVSIALKVTGAVEWTWFWALFPLWILPVTFVYGVVLAVCVIGAMKLYKSA